MMKKLFIYFTFCLALIIKISAQTPADRYSSAMEAYNNAEYFKAHQLFEEFFSDYKLTDELYAAAKYYSAESLLNMGNKESASSQYEFLVNNFLWTSFRDRALYRLGLIYFEEGAYTRSREKLKTLLDDYPESEHTGSALYWIGESYTEQNRLEDAITFLEDAVSSKKNNKYIDYSIYTLASLYEKIGDYESAVKYYDQLLSYHKNSSLAPSAQIRIGICYFKLKDYQASILELNSPLLNDLPLDLYSESLYLLANSYYRVQDYENAERTYSEIINEFPESDVMREVKYGLAWTYFQQEKYDDSFRIFNSLSLVEDSIGIKSFYWKGESKRYSGQEAEAFKIFDEFLKKYPDNPLASGVKYQVGSLYFNTDRFDDASKYLELATESSSKDIQARSYIMLADIELSKTKYEAARQHFESALNISGISESLQNRGMLGLGITLFYLNKYKDAISYLTDVDFRDPSFEKDKLNFYLAENYFALGNFKDALDRYQRVNIDDPEVGAYALYGKAYSYFNMKSYTDAASFFADFVKKYPDDPKVVDAKLRLADSHYGSKNFAAASRIYKDIFKAGKSSLNDPYSHYQYAQALFKAGSVNEAINEFKDLREKYPNSEYADRALYVVGWINFQQNNFNEAISSYRNVLNTYPGSSLSPIIYYSIGDAYFNQGRYDSAIVNYQRVLTSYPSSNYVFDAMNGLQYSYVAQGNPERAVQLIDEFVSRNPGLGFSDQLFFKKGEIYYSLRQYEDAKLSYKEFISNYPKSKLIPEAYYWIGKSSQNLNQSEEALFNFRHVVEGYPSSETAIAAAIEMGNIYNAQQSYDMAVSVYNRVLDKMEPGSKRIAEVLFMKGMTFVNQNKAPESYEVFEEIIQYYPNSIFADKAKLELGLIELAASRYENADTYFKDLAGKRTDDLGAQAQYHYGLSLFEQNKLNESISAFVRVRTIFSAYDEWLTRSYLKLGEIYTKLEEPDRAKEMYRAVLARHKGDIFGQEAQTKLRELQ